MTLTQADAAGRIRIGGIRLSREMVQLNTSASPGDIDKGLRLYRHLAENRINIPFLGIGCSGGKTVRFCCLEVEDIAPVQRLFELEPQQWTHVEWVFSVGTVTIFPHQSDLNLLGAVISVMGKARIPIYAMGTSLSALTISTDFRMIDRLVDVLTALLDLPANHTPFRPGVRIKQILAVRF